MRLLRTYERKAKLDHFCDRCTEYIQAGQVYEGFVYAVEKHIMVVKQHVDPSCDFPEEPGRESVNGEDFEDSSLEDRIAA